MLNLVNWWFPYSVSQIESAISVGYHVHVVFTKGESRLDVLEFLARKHLGKLFYSVDTTPRYSKAAHTQTRCGRTDTVTDGALTKPPFTSPSRGVPRRRYTF